ncbi:hypothetical protein HG530_011781 [Fusarium avenaceum]|nr:hypothetical protein HG530_011781 [Fusarium avenaceum]
MTTLLQRQGTWSRWRVHVRVDDEVALLVEERGPEGSTLEVILQHDWDALINSLDSLENSVHGVKADDDMHVVPLNGILSDPAQMLLLLTRVESRPRDLDPSRVSSGDAEGVDSDLGKRVDGRGVKERCIALFQDRAALFAESLAQTPLISCGRSLRTERGPPDGIVVPLLCEPSAEVDTVGLERLPVYELTTITSLGEGNIVVVSLCVGFDGSNTEGALLFVLGRLAMVGGIGGHGEA